MKGQLRITGTILLLLALIVNGTVLAVPDVVRLHIIANSNSPEDQRIKEKVRDDIVDKISPVLADMEQKDVARWIIENESLIASIAAGTLAEAGFDYPVKVSFGVVDYPTRVYGIVAYPAGKYRSLRVELGSAAGRNWWCVMFPPLCLVNETIETGDKLMEPESVKVRFWLLDKLIALFRIGGEKCDRSTSGR